MNIFTTSERFRIYIRKHKLIDKFTPHSCIYREIEMYNGIEIAGQFEFVNHPEFIIHILRNHVRIYIKRYNDDYFLAVEAIGDRQVATLIENIEQFLNYVKKGLINETRTIESLGISASI